jgi:hypothetical protein
MRSDRRRHLERVVEERGRALSTGTVDEATLAALSAKDVPRGARVVWVESGLRPPQADGAFLDFPPTEERSAQLFGEGEAGSQVAPWIAPGFAYEFRLLAWDTDARALASVTVVAEATPQDQPRSEPRPNKAAVVAQPNPTPLTGTHGVTTISWSTGNGSIGRVELTTYRLDEGVPEDDNEAVAALETLRGQGADFLLIPQASFWWLRLYPGLDRHLDTRYRVIVNDPRTGRLYDLRA